MADIDMLESDFEDDFVDDEESDFDFDEENVVKPTKTGKSSSNNRGAKSSKKSVLGVNSEASNTVAPKASSSKKDGKTVEEMYQKKTQLEHILLRPDTYIGSCERITQEMYVLDSETKKLVLRKVTFTPGLYKIFDEIVVNAADNKQRDDRMNSLEVMIDQEGNKVSVKNNGKGIPVVIHKEHQCYVPTMIFGHLLTGSNFDDDEKKTTGGRNGYGAKLANIFSTEFVVECVDAERGLKFVQTFRDNMHKADDPVVNKCSPSEKKRGDYTKITFSPDLDRFQMNELDDDAVALMSKRAYDIAGSMASRRGPRLAVTLNGQKLPIKNFKDYLANIAGMEQPCAYEKVNDRWEVGLGIAEGTFSHISFVNAIATSKGGNHCIHIADQVAAHLQKVVKKKNKGGVEIKPNQIKNHLFVFVNCLIENPKFDSQTKEFMTNKKSDFGSTCQLSPKFLKQVEKSGVVDAVLSFARFKQGQALKRKGGVKKTKLTGITKLDDANFAGGAKSKDCTLIVTEGDSAKSLAMSGLSVVGRDYYGVFPLKGKPLNVRDASHAAIMKNEEIKNLVDIMGLKFGFQYDEKSIRTLRYGHLMIMADQDHDGSHIKGLLINFLQYFWPTLLDVPGFLQQFITPIVKATKGKKSITFFTLPEYENWRESTGNDGKGWTVKYYKGLGTSTAAEAKEYFSNLELHEVHFQGITADKVISAGVTAENDEDDMDFGESEATPVPDKVVSGSDLIDMVFAKSRVEDRKTWLNGLQKDTYLDYNAAQEEGIQYSEFINKEFILFSQADNARSIPHVMDGFKPSQRKVLFSCFKRKLRAEIKVAQLAGYVSEHSAYHHGEASLNGTIINMAQNFCGSNNVNLLTPSGQFGTRRMGGKDAASPRYVFTKLENITRTIFHPDDDELLTYLSDDGLSIEPEYYMPVIPMILVNGSDGIGTGWSTSIPNHNPREIIKNIRLMIAGDEPQKMEPYYYGYNGEIVPEPDTPKKKGSYKVLGKIERTSDTTIAITELPLKKWTQDYKAFLETMIDGDGKKKEPEIKDFVENHTDTTVSFTITATKEQIDGFEKVKNGLVGKFKLASSLGTSNMTVFDTERRIGRFTTAEAILKGFFGLRTEYYGKRKALLLSKLRRDQTMLANKARFVEEVCSGELVVSNRKRSEILADLQERGYDLIEKTAKESEADNESEGEEAEATSDADLAKGYEYLLGMKIWSLTYEKAEELRAKLAEKTQEVEELEATEPSQLWLNDLDAIEVALDERDDEMDAAAKEEAKAQKKSKKMQTKKAKKNAAKSKKAKKKKDEWDSDIEGDSEEEQMHLDSDSDSFGDVLPKKAPTKRKNTKSATAKALKAPAIAKKQVKPASAKAPPRPTMEDSDESFERTISEQLEKIAVSPQPKKSRFDEKKRNHPTTSEGSEDDLEVINVTDFVPASVTPAKAKAKKATYKKSQAAKKPAAKKPATKRTKAPAVKQPIMEEDSDDELDFEREESPVVARSSRRQATRTRKTVKYDLSDNSDEESDFDDF